MSTSKRKVKKYVLMMKDNKSANRLPGKAITDIFSAVAVLPEADRILDHPAKNKFYILDRCDFDVDIVTGFFTSAKYNHRPDLISKVNLKRRPNPKAIEEGESEKTHFAIISLPKEAIMLLEAKGGGISLGPLLRYLTRYTPNGAHLEADLFAGTTFVKKLQEMVRATSVNVYTGQTFVNPTFGLDREMPEVQDDVIVTFRAKKRSSVKKYINKIYANLSGSPTSQITRIRVSGKSENNDDVVIDTERLTDSEFVGVDLDANGQVISDSFVPRLKDILRSIV